LVQIVTGNLVEVSSAVRIEIFNGVKYENLNEEMAQLGFHDFSSSKKYNISNIKKDIWNI
jgi:NTP pyrophosphatase (non-canonical NTP hydrolase)